MSIRFGGILAQSRKLSEIASNFGHFFALPNLVYGTSSKICVQFVLQGLTSWILSRMFNDRFKKVFGDPPRPGLWCALASLGQTVARVKISATSTRKARNTVFRKSRLRWVHTHMIYFLGSGPKFTGCLLHNAGSHVFPIFDILTRSGDICDEVE